MAFMTPRASLMNFDSFFNQDDAVEKHSGRISYLPSHNLLVLLSSSGEVTVFTGKHTSPDQHGLQSFKPKANISLETDSVCSVRLLSVSTKKTSIIGGNWCCVVVGTTTGSILFFNEEGILILRQNIFAQPVTLISTSINSALQGFVYATSGSSVDLVNYSELVSTLESNLNSALLSPHSPPPLSAPLNWKHLRLPQVKNTQQILVTNNAVNECYFDQLERCTIDRYATRGEVSNANQLLVSSVGSDPYFSFTASKEMSQTNIVSHIAVAVATKFTKMISDSVPFWGSSKSSVDSEADQQPKISSLSCHNQHGIFDRDRLGTGMCISPSKRFVAVVDSLARVVLVDASTGIPLYMKKGYRRAQMGWISCSSSDGSGRSVELLVIYSAKSMQIDVWNTRKANRVTAFSAPEGLGVLLYDSGSISAAGNDDNFPSMDRQSYFLTKSGVLYDISMSLSEALEFEDLVEMQGHLDDLAEVRKMLQDYQPEKLDRIEKLLRRFKRVSLLQQILKMVCDCPQADVNLMDSLIVVVKGKNLRGIRKSSQRLQESISKLERVLEIYKYFKGIENLSEADGSQLSRCGDLITLKEQISTFGPVFKYIPVDDLWIESVTPHEFVNCFNIMDDSLEKKILIEEEDRDNLIARILVRLSDDEHLFRLISECEVCLWSLAKCILHAFFDSSASESEQWDRIFTALTAVLREVQTLDENAEPFLQQVYEEICCTDNVPAAMVACYIWRCILGGERANLLDEVEDTLECKIFCGLYKQLQSILPLSALLRCRIKDEALPFNSNARLFPISLKSLRKSEGHISDVVSQWICEQRLSHKDLRRALNNSTVCPCVESPVDTSTISLEVALQLLCLVRSTFPVSLQLETLLANCCWSYLCLWDRNYEDAEMLRWSLEYLKAIQPYKLKEGLCHMIWKSHLQSRVISLARMMEQSGCIPPDPLLDKHVQVGKHTLGEFLNLCSSILDIIIESMLPSDDVEVLCIVSKEEALSPGTLSSPDGDPSLISRALGLPVVLRDTVHLHYSLVTILATCVQFNHTEVKPLSLFDSAAQSALSSDLCEVYTRYNQSLTSNNPLSSNRTAFLRRSIDACVQLLPELCNSQELLECQLTMGRLVDLAHAWDIDTDVVNKEYVLQLYSSGHDSLAQEVMVQMSDRSCLVDNLMLIVGLRVKYHLGDIDYTTCERMGAVSTRVNRWIADLPERTLRCTNKDLQSTLGLVQTLLNIVDDGITEETILNEAVLLLSNIK